MQTCRRRLEPELRGPRDGPEIGPPELPSGALCCVLRADPNGEGEKHLQGAEVALLEHTFLKLRNLLE
eukprot:7106944-Alexandrium_andersonii.AAC.1